MSETNKRELTIEQKAELFDAWENAGRRSVENYWAWVCSFLEGLPWGDLVRDTDSFLLGYNKAKEICERPRAASNPSGSGLPPGRYIDVEGSTWYRMKNEYGEEVWSRLDILDS